MVMATSLKAQKINLFSFSTPQMRAFHMSWMTFFLCFFAWFGLAPLMPVIKKEFHLTKDQVANLAMASVSMTVFARLLIGWLCDKIGPRLCYSGLLILGSLPVLFVGLSHGYGSYLFFRFAIGIIGASFVITQYHTSVMFAPNVVGTANATTAGWGNLGGGVTQIAMPLLFSVIVGLGFTEAASWRIAMLFPGAALFVMGVLYYKLTQDTPEGNVLELKKSNPEYKAKNEDAKGSFWMACKDYRVWILALVYGACFGIELTFDGIAALYFSEEFGLGLTTAGVIAASFGMMNLFARALGGIFSDRIGVRFGLKGRLLLLMAFLIAEGLGIVLFSKMAYLPMAIASLIFFALFVKMSNGVTYSVVPFINKKSLGAVAGIVGAGGNIGALMANSLFKSMSYREGFFIIGISVVVVGFLAFLIRVPKEVALENAGNKEERKEKSLIV
jgi:NNP family nitrate/nitrite transporter-like MFS transporter